MKIDGLIDAVPGTAAVTEPSRGRPETGREQNSQCSVKTGRELRLVIQSAGEFLTSNAQDQRAGRSPVTVADGDALSIMDNSPTTSPTPRVSIGPPLGGRYLEMAVEHEKDGIDRLRVTDQHRVCLDVLGRARPRQPVDVLLAQFAQNIQHFLHKRSPSPFA
jgi:hypothetical protein